MTTKVSVEVPASADYKVVIVSEFVDAGDSILSDDGYASRDASPPVFVHPGETHQGHLYGNLMFKVIEVPLDTPERGYFNDEAI